MSTPSQPIKGARAMQTITCWATSWATGIAHHPTQHTAPGQPETHTYGLHQALLVAVGATLIFLALVATPALAAPEFGLTVEHRNAYGQQGGVDPFTGSATTFDRESGFNEYSIQVTNPSLKTGETLTCAAGSWTSSPTSFTYQWLRDGAPIVGANSGSTTATSYSYTLQAEDVGKAIQCEVIGSNISGAEGGATAKIGSYLMVAPEPAHTLPAPPASITEPTPKGSQPAGTTLTCAPGVWRNATALLTYQWLKNGSPIAGATNTTYQIQAADVPSAIQCEVMGTNSFGSVTLISGRKNTSPAPSPAAPIGKGGESVTVTGGTAGATSGTISVGDQLPEGLVLRGPTVEKEIVAPGWSCKIGAGATSVTCTRSEALMPGAYYEPIVLHVYVDPETASEVRNVVAVSGGGAITATRSDPTTVATVPFGLNVFTTSVTESLGDPFTQAVGHPFLASTELVFNAVPNQYGGIDDAGGGPKGVEVELPPGFIGNPQAGAQCPLGSLKGNDCPADTAVGYVQLSTGGGEIVGGHEQPFEALTSENSSLVYSLQSPPGHPAEFGFVYFGGIPIILTAKIRSDGDYGVTIASDGIPNVQKLLATRLTFCEGGATEVTTPFSYHCDPASAQSEAFLTNPARCSSVAPTTTAQASPWNEPAVEVSQTVYTGTKLVEEKASESESFVTGCSDGELHTTFDASGIALSPGTSQADAPTGMAFAVIIPQSGESSKLATPELRNASVTLPAGMTLSPSAAEGLEGCTNAQIALHSLSAGSCPDGSQVGTMEVFTPLLSAAPKAEGVPDEGGQLVCSSGTWNGGPTLSYQWLRDGVVIAGATGREYEVQAADNGEPVQCQVTATNAGGSSVAVSREAVVTPEPATAPALLQSSIPAPAGTASAGNGLKCSTGVWAGSPTFTYQWLRGGAPIAGAEAAEYTLTGQDTGTAVQCEVKAGNAGGTVVGDSAAVVVSPGPSPEVPLLGAPLQGKVFLGTPECSPCSSQDAQEGHIFRLFLEVEDPTAGVIVKLPGNVSANPSTGQLTATFKENPQLPFEELKLVFKGGPQAPLATPQACGQATTTSDLTPWSSEPGINEAQGTPDAFPSSSFNVDWDGHGGACPSGVPFAPSFQAQTASSTASAYTPFTVRFTREDREQDLSQVSVSMPPGLLGTISKVSQCGEPQAANGTCQESSRIGSTTVGAGPGSHPFYLSGPVYLTGPYEGAPFGLSMAVPAVAGPFNLGTVVVRAAINVNPSTAAITVTSDPLPQIVDGVPLRLRDVRVAIDREGFMFNPTNCSAQAVGASIAGERVNNGEADKTSSVSSSFAVGGCAGLPFVPSFSAATQGVTSKANGASLDVRVAQKSGEANIQKVDVQLPKLLPSRLTTLQQACTAAQFAANPAVCPAASDVGVAVAHTPVLNGPLVGPAYLVSHGGAAFPDLEIILQGEGVTIVLDGNTNIKKGVTFSRFETVPDAPISSFELNLPEGPHSILAAPSGVCGTGLVMPTTITGQNGKQVIQNTKIAANGCETTKAKPLTRAQKLAKALKACRKKKNKRKRAVCERQARKKYGPIKKAKKTNRRGK